MTNYRPILEEYFGKFEINKVLNLNEQVNGFRLILVSPKGEDNFMPGFGGIGSGVPEIARPILKSLTDICGIMGIMQQCYEKQIINLEFEVERISIEEERKVETGINIRIKTKEQKPYELLIDTLYGVGVCARNCYNLLKEGQL